MKYLRLFWEMLFGKKKVLQPLSNFSNDLKVETDDILIKEELDDYDKWLKLEEEKKDAITKCNGCRDEVFILKKDNEDIGYYSSINALSTANGFPARSIYHWWTSYTEGKKDPERKWSRSNPKYKGIYEITKLE